jgi:general secretion pathway protein E
MITDAAPLPSLLYAFARENGVVVLGEDGGALRVGHRGPLALETLLEVRRAIGRPVQFEAMAQEAFEEALSQRYGAAGLGSGEFDEPADGEDGQSLASLLDGVQKTEDLLASGDDAPIVRLINGIIAEAIRRKASDIHIEPYENRLAIRFRVDGVLQEIISHSRRVSSPLVSRIKVMARLDIAEKRVPQDGRISLSLGGRMVDVRISTLPSRFGERVVMRLLEKDRGLLSLTDIGMPEDIRRRFRDLLDRPNGIVLVTGPTGSGKTTTLYAGLMLLNDQTRNILTVEDPIEYGLEGVGQTQVNAKVGMTFATGLRAILRQDPDVVMVGEIRDRETAAIAVQASLTGHLVLSTVHTNSAIAAITRLRDMGVEPFLMSSALAGVLAQRLVRRLCPSCRVEEAPTPLEASRFELPAGARIWRGAGCPDCNHSGYRGRVGVYELVVVDETLRKLIHDNASEQALVAQAHARSGQLSDAARQLVLEGMTSPEEAVRIAHVDDDLKVEFHGDV